MIIFLLLIAFSPSLLAVTSLEQTITLNARVEDNFTMSERLSTEIIGPSFQPIIYNERSNTFQPIFFRVVSTAEKSVEQFSFNVNFKEMSCSTSLTNKNVVVLPELSVEPGDIREVNNKITLNGQRYWSVVEYNGSNKYLSDLIFKVSFPSISQLQNETMYCVGYIVLVSSIDI
ncbi:MAG: hypothetical protein ACRDAT_06415 [Cetobacterium sp.]